jgi:2,3-bisphosphoglycerate-independent phosphoglycerate mutase
LLGGQDGKKQTNQQISCEFARFCAEQKIYRYAGLRERMANNGLRKALCVVMDGIGLRKERFGNAVVLSETPNLHWLAANCPSTTLQAHGKAVGLPSDDDIGNSEVGHNALGAGQIFDQGAKLVQKAIENGSLFQGQTWLKATARTITNQSTLHFLGLLSDGNVHAHEEHLYAMLRAAKRAGVKRVRVHPLLDGRDVAEKSAEIYCGRLLAVIAELKAKDFDIAVASGGGRMIITMDRYEADWAMVERGWHAHVLGRAELKYESLTDALADLRRKFPVGDQYLPGFVITENGAPVGTVENGDSVIFFNFRGDRAIEISRAFTEEKFTMFERLRTPDVFYAGMMEYDGDLHIPTNYLVQPPAIDNTLSEYLLKHKLRQFACSETQKFGHVTYFWNGNRSGYLDPFMEEYVEIPSDKNITFDEKPAMKAKEICDATIERMERGTFDFGRINFANGDMVGHTGNLRAAIHAVETVDAQVGRLIEAARKTNYMLFVTADHGNADEMFAGKEKDYPDWASPHPAKIPPPKTAHTLAPVPLYVFDPTGWSKGLKLVQSGNRSLANLAATMVQSMGLPPNPIFLPSLWEKAT